MNKIISVIILIFVLNLFPFISPANAQNITCCPGVAGCGGPGTTQLPLGDPTCMSNGDTNCEDIIKGSDTFKKVLGSFNLDFLKTCRSYFQPLTFAQIIFTLISILPFFLLVLVIINILRGAFKMIRSEGDERNLVSGRKMIINSVVGFVLLLLYFFVVVNIFSMLLFGEPYMVVFNKVFTEFNLFFAV